MFELKGLAGWEIVALAGLCAVGWLAVASAIGFGLSWLVCRERKPAARPVAAAQPAPQPVVPAPKPAVADRAPEYAATTV